MPKTGDNFITTLKKSHLGWGDDRNTNSRTIIKGEGYLQIPKEVAVKLEIYNKNKPDCNVIYNCNSADGYLKNVALRAEGCSTKGDIYAKQFAGNGNLKLLGNWFENVNAKEGDKVKITWTSSTDIKIEKL